MFNGNEKVKQIVALVLRILVAGYIGFMGIQMIVRRPDDASPWFMVAAVFFLVMAVFFIIFSTIMFFRTWKDITEKKDDESGEAVSDGTEATGAQPVRTDAVSADRPGGMGIRDMARYRSADIEEEPEEAQETESTES